MKRAFYLLLTVFYLLLMDPFLVLLVIEAKYQVWEAMIEWSLLSSSVAINVGRPSHAWSAEIAIKVH